MRAAEHRASVLDCGGPPPLFKRHTNCAHVNGNCHRVGLTKALGRGAFGRYGAEVAAGIKSAAGIVDENII
jgi:hypothetical protein